MTINTYDKQISERTIPNKLKTTHLKQDLKTMHKRKSWKTIRNNETQTNTQMNKSEIKNFKHTKTALFFEPTRIEQLFKQ